MREWLQKKPDLNRCRGGKVESGPLEVTCGTALHWAAFYGKIEIAKLLLENDASMFTAGLHITIAGMACILKLMPRFRTLLRLVFGVQLHCRPEGFLRGSEVYVRRVLALYVRTLVSGKWYNFTYRSSGAAFRSSGAAFVGNPNLDSNFNDVYCIHMYKEVIIIKSAEDHELLLPNKLAVFPILVDYTSYFLATLIVLFLADFYV